jgi:hypothetical protein
MVIVCLGASVGRKPHRRGSGKAVGFEARGRLPLLKLVNRSFGTASRDSY